MSQWPSVKAKRLLAALLRLDWQIKRQSGSHKTLTLMAGLILFLPSMMATKSAPKCWRALQNIPACLQMTCNPALKQDAAEVRHPCLYVEIPKSGFVSIG